MRPAAILLRRCSNFSMPFIRYRNEDWRLSLAGNLFLRQPFPAHAAGNRAHQ